MNTSLLLLLLATPARADLLFGEEAFEERSAAGAADEESAAEGPKLDRGAVEPAEALAAIDAKIGELESLRYGAVRTTERNGTLVEERWRFAMEGERFRVDYTGDTQRIVIFNGHILIDYVPQLRQAMHYELDRLDEAEAQRILSAVLSKIAVPGMRAGADPSWAWRWGEAAEVGGVPGLELIGSDAEGELTFTISEDGERLLSSQIRQAGSFVVEVTAYDHAELAPGIWVPQRVEMRAPASGGVGDVNIRLSGAAANQELPDSLFDVQLDPSIELQVVR